MKLSEKKKGQAGLTLVELIVAVSILMLFSGSLLGMIFHGVQLSMTAHRTNMAAFESQLQVEQLVGLPLTEDNIEYLVNQVAHQTGPPIGLIPGLVGGAGYLFRTSRFISNGFWIELQFHEFDAFAGAPDPPDPIDAWQLLELQVRIFRNNTTDSALLEHSHVLNVFPGGFYADVADDD